ncbi:MAG: phosphate ABC transporter permease subunit PstC [Methanocellales archaeon]
MKRDASDKIVKRRISISADSIFHAIIATCAISIIILAFLLFYELLNGAQISILKFGLNFLLETTWDPVFEVFGALPFIFGTLLSSLIALIIAIPLSVGVAIYLSELAPSKIRDPFSFVIELIAAIPSVIIGLWGIFVLAPVMRDFIMPFLADTLGFLPFFQGPRFGLSMLTGGVILAIMIIPIISSVSREVLLAVPDTQREAALALGATKWEMITMAVIPYARPGIFGAIILGFGRAIGETMAITMVIGNSPTISWSLFSQAHTMAAVIANEFTEATYDLYISALIEIGLLLFIITLIINILARLLIWRMKREVGRE